MAEADDLDALVIPSSVKLAGGMLMGAGACLGVTGLQAMLLEPTGYLRLMPPMMLILSGGCVFSGWGVVRGRARSASFGVGLGAAAALVALAWVVVTFLNGVISLITMLAVPLSLAATTLIAVGLKAVRKIDEARERLRSQGLDAGL